MRICSLQTEKGICAGIRYDDRVLPVDEINTKFDMDFPLSLGELIAQERLDELKVLIRIANESHAFKGFKSFQHAIEGTVSVSKQNEGWIRSLPK